MRVVFVTPRTEMDRLSIEMKPHRTNPLRVREAGCHRGVGNLDVSLSHHCAVELRDDSVIHHAIGKRDACAKGCCLTIEQFENLFRAGVSQRTVVARREVSFLRGIVDRRRTRQGKIGSKVYGSLCH